MVKRLFALLAVVILLTGAASAVRAQGGDDGRIPAILPDLGGRSITIVSSNDYVPLSFIDAQTGKPVGLEYELWGEICKRLNCTIKWEQSAWDGMIVAVNQGQFDVGMVGISITDERKSQVDFSDPYLVVEQKFLVRADESRFTGQKDFVANENLKIGAQAGTSGFYTGSAILGENSPRLALYDNFGLSVQALLSGDVDAVIADNAAGRGYIGANEGKLKMLDEVLYTDPLGFIFTPKSDLVAPVNQALAAMKADGYLDYLNNKWFFLFDPSQDQPAAEATAEATAAQ
jgi:ABC-type amino acid transport substrate-binding protein